MSDKRGWANAAIVLLAIVALALTATLFLPKHRQPREKQRRGEVSTIKMQVSREGPGKGHCEIVTNSIKGSSSNLTNLVPLACESVNYMGRFDKKRSFLEITSQQVKEGNEHIMKVSLTLKREGKFPITGEGANKSGIKALAGAQTELLLKISRETP